MADLVVMAATQRVEEARRRLRVAPHGSVNRRKQEFKNARTAQLAAEMEVLTQKRRH